MGEGREIGKADRGPVEPVGSRWTGTASKSAGIPEEGRLREPSLQALLRDLAAFNNGLCVVTTRLPVGDIADHEYTSAPRRDLEQLSSDAGASLLPSGGGSKETGRCNCEAPATSSAATVLL